MRLNNYYNPDRFYDRKPVMDGDEQVGWCGKSTEEYWYSDYEPGRRGIGTRPVWCVWDMDEKVLRVRRTYNTIRSAVKELGYKLGKK